MLACQFVGVHALPGLCVWYAVWLQQVGAMTRQGGKYSIECRSLY
jgi:hypothetical protein